MSSSTSLRYPASAQKKVTITGNKETALGTVTVNWDNVEIFLKKERN